MKGVIVSGGSGSRLAPLIRITNKHLLPLYDPQMVTYAVEALVETGIDELMLVTGDTHAGEFFRVLGNGYDYGIDRIFYAYQEQEGGVAEALGLPERFVAGDRCCVLLADNVFERELGPVVRRFEVQERGAALIVLSKIEEDEHLRHLGVAASRASTTSRPARYAPSCRSTPARLSPKIRHIGRGRRTTRRRQGDTTPSTPTSRRSASP